MTETSSVHWQMLLAVWRKLTSRWAAVSSGRTRWQASTTRSHVPATQKVSKRGITDLKLLDRPCAHFNQTCGSHHAAILLLIMSYKPASTIGQSNPSFHLWIKWQQSWNKIWKWHPITVYFLIAHRKRYKKLYRGRPVSYQRALATTRFIPLCESSPRYTIE